uniref:Uncharacterized protein n=1 Tax=Vitis vinifera TaxID=29760 RepID=A5BNZ8_VITVI|nr:hypothetical protein VITISV_040298 [Vitis vinifera]
MGWLPIVTILELIFSKLVRAFYSRVTYGLGGPIISTVRGVEIQLDPKSICRIFDITPVGFRTWGQGQVHPGVEEKTEIREMEISSLGTRMEELAVVSDTRFYSMEDCMDQYQTGFTYQFEYLQQRFERFRGQKAEPVEALANRLNRLGNRSIGWGIGRPRLKENRLYAKKKKCEFTQTEIKFLRHLVFKKQIQMDGSKMAAIHDWPSPTKGCRWGEDYWKIGGLAASINSPCVRRGRLGECTIRLGYAPFLTTIAFRRVGSA